MTYEIDGVRFKSELLEKFSAAILLSIKLVLSLWILLVILVDVDKEVPASALLEKSHEIGFDGFCTTRWHLLFSL